MKNIELSENFKPAGSPKNLSEGSAITIGAGVSLQELYSAAGKKGKTVVAGASHTVGAAGGYIQGGGHSFLGPWKGMSTDNVLEYTVVTADVCDHPDAKECWLILP
jgi:FAD/FMN-containing dehydrogenase